MPRFDLEIPAYHTDRDYDRRLVTTRLDHLPRRGDQIEVSEGLVEVVNVRHRPQWTTEHDTTLVEVYGVGYAFNEKNPIVFTNWVRRPDGTHSVR